MDPMNGYCVGCMRTIDESRDWIISTPDGAAEDYRLMPGRKGAVRGCSTSHAHFPNQVVMAQGFALGIKAFGAARQCVRFKLSRELRDERPGSVKRQLRFVRLDRSAVGRGRWVGGLACGRGEDFRGCDEYGTEKIGFADDFYLDASWAVERVTVRPLHRIGQAFAITFESRA